MTRLRHRSALAGLILMAGLLSAPGGQAQPPQKKEENKPAEIWLLDRTLTVSSAPAPIPALKYRLYPRTTDRKDGNAVPIYLRFAHERSDATKKLLREKPDEWNKLTLEKLPLTEVQPFLDNYKYHFHQLDLGARRKTAEWNYTLDAGNPIGILLPDAQEIRMYAPLLVLKARVEMAAGRFPDAIRTLETGFSLSQQISEGPFLITDLIAIACATKFADCLLEVIERPNAPNLYWALAVLPRPLVEQRKSNEFEQQILELQFPYLADLDRIHSPEEWDMTLRRFRKDVEQIFQGSPNVKPVKPGSAVTDPAAKSSDLPTAKKYLAEVVGMAAARIDTMSPAEVLIRYQMSYYHEIRDELFKGYYIPFPQSQPLFVEAERRLKSGPDTEAARLAEGLLPILRAVRLAQIRIERKLASLRAIEALRMHAAANGGELPDRLDQVKVAPVPNDPGTGQPFEYHRDGPTATLTSRIPGEPLNQTGLRYRITLRK
jgi:hypothetical protein